MTVFASEKYEGVVTCEEDPTNILRKPTPPIGEEEWDLVRSTVQKLIHVREKVLKGGAGLAAPQIGINHPIFIYTPDRTTENLRIVVNPSFEPLGESILEGYEACFSIPLHCVKLKRWEKIKVKYQNLEGISIEKILDGFEAKAFQHEMDHLQGKLTIDHEEAQIQVFTNTPTFQEHMRHVHLEDSKNYLR